MSKILKKEDHADLNKVFKKQKSESKEAFKEALTTAKMEIPKTARKEARSTLKKTTKKVNVIKKSHLKTRRSLKAKVASGKALTSDERTLLKESHSKLKGAKLANRRQKNLYRQTKKIDPTLIRHQVKTEASLRVKQDIKYKATSLIQEDETVGEAVSSVRKASQTKMNMRQALKVTKTSTKLSGKVLKGTYGLSNRTYNLTRGRGFYRTPPDLTLRSKARVKMSALKMRKTSFLKHQQQQASHVSAKIVKSIVNGIKLIATNPLTWIALGVFLVLFIVFGAVSSNSQYAIMQEEKDLTDAWVAWTKLDTDHNDESTTFFTNGNNAMFYMNNEYEDYRIKHQATFGKTYQDYLSDLWEAVNGKDPNYSFVAVDDLLKDKDTPYFMKTSDYDDYKELVTTYGFETLEGQLSFPFKTDELTVSRRYGYEGQKKEAKLFDKLIVDVSEGTDVVSPMDGVVTNVISEDEVELTDKEGAYRLHLKGVKTARLSKGTTVTETGFLGVASRSDLTIHYSLLSGKKEWESVNPAFYFPKVIYAQQTLIGSDFDSASLSPEVTALIPKFKEAMKEVGMSEKFLSIVLAVCMQESGGRVIDVMQSSESLELPPNTLGTDDSIRQGVKYLWDSMKLVGIDLINQDEKYVKTAVQAYNFGIGFIPYSKSKGYAYSEELAVAFAMHMSGGTGAYGDSKYVAHVWRYIGGSSANPNGKFAYPLPNKLNDVSGFDYRYNPITGAYELHLGLDLPVPMGTPVFASEDAEVMRNSDVGDTYGINVVLKHKKGSWWTRYAHLSRATVSVGQSVKRGQLIGNVGSTGMSTGPHLHYETMTSLYGGHVNPRPFIE